MLKQFKLITKTTKFNDDALLNSKIFKYALKGCYISHLYLRFFDNSKLFDYPNNDSLNRILKYIRRLHLHFQSPQQFNNFNFQPFLKSSLCNEIKIYEYGRCYSTNQKILCSTKRLRRLDIEGSLKDDSKIFRCILLLRNLEVLNLPNVKSMKKLYLNRKLTSIGKLVISENLMKELEKWPNLNNIGFQASKNLESTEDLDFDRIRHNTNTIFKLQSDKSVLGKVLSQKNQFESISILNSLFFSLSGKELDPIFQQKWLKSLKLSALPKITMPIWRDCLASIEYFEVSCFQSAENHDKLLAEMVSWLSQVKMLRIYINFQAKCIENLSHCSKLLKLEFKQINEITSETLLSFMKNITSLSNLRSMSLSPGKIVDLGSLNKAYWSKLNKYLKLVPNLQEIELYINFKLQFCFYWLNSCRSLRKIVFSHTLGTIQLDSELLDELDEFLTTLPNLRTFHLIYKIEKIGSFGLKKLIAILKKKRLTECFVWINEGFTFKGLYDSLRV